MRRLLVMGTVLSLLFASASLADEIKIEGGGTSITTIFMPIKERFEKMRGDSLSIVESTAVKGLIALNEGKVDIATGAHPLEDLIAGAAQKGVIIDPSSLVATKVEENRLVVVTNRNNPVAKLTKDQLKGIFTGKITNWKDVGGKDLPVEVVWGKDTLGQNIQFTRIALDGQPVTANVRQATTYRSIAEVVGEGPGAIGVIPLQISTPATRALDTISITSPMYVITKGRPSEKVQEVIDFYKTEYTLE
jgi:phosphate transport system substrate-binding protein